MRGKGGLLRLGEYLVGRACRGLPAEERDERYREWTAELPAILHDPGIRLPWHRALADARLWQAAGWSGASGSACWAPGCMGSK
jgi:hypothetical protein